MKSSKNSFKFLVSSGQQRDTLVNREFEHSVLSAVSDDYEDINQILNYLHRFHEVSLSPATKGEVAEAMADLIASGLAQAYLLSPQPPHSTKVDFDPSRIDELWFYVTPEGKKFVQELNQQAE